MVQILLILEIIDYLKGGIGEVLNDETQVLLVHDMGLIDYQEGWDYQEELFKKAIDHKISVRKGESKGTASNHLLFCQHPHVYTLGKSGKKEHFCLMMIELSKKKKCSVL